MIKKSAKSKGPRMSDTAVQAKTGKTWDQWFAILDRAGARKMTHQEIANHLYNKLDVGPWWSQMVTVTYEQERGLRDKHQKADGYSFSASRTLSLPVGKVFRSFANEKTRKTWLPESGLVVRKTTRDKSMRVTWPDGKSSLEIYFVPKADDKSQVVVQHSKLPDAKTAAKMKVYWTKALDRLRDSLDS